jgi:hypothetical protein
MISLETIKRYYASIKACKSFDDFLKKAFDRIFIIYSYGFARLLRTPLIQVAGDSHIFTFKNKKPFIVHFMGSATMYNLCRKESSTKSNQKLFDLANRINKKKDVLMLVFGEIDCRIHIYYQYEKNNRKYAISELIEKTILNYGKVLKALRLMNVRFCVYGIPPASRQANIYNFPFYATEEMRYKINKEFNDALREFCSINGYIYLDIYSEFSDENGFTLKEYLYDEVHLNRKICGIIKEKIRKALNIVL